MGEFPGSFQDILIPANNSLFSLLTIYGSNTNLPPGLGEPTGFRVQYSWRPGGIYRILSFGKSANGPPSAGIWLNGALHEQRRKTVPDIEQEGDVRG